MIITNNLLAHNAALNLGIISNGKGKSLEKLSSGYRVNRSSDDAAGLSISEKMRSQVRGLMRAAENTKDGINLIHTTDGATDQAGNILQRMRELSIQALNIAVNTEDDRAKIQAEFDELQSELDRINDQTEFNKKPCFTHYDSDHYVINGNKVWPQDQLHSITDENNSLTITYKKEPDGPDCQATIRVPSGIYTTQQLIDEIDDATGAMGLDPEKLSIEYSDSGTCNMVLEKGASISDMEGGLGYLFHDEHVGTPVGSLIGTTIFDPNSAGLQIYSGHNDEMKFTIDYMDGRASKKIEIKIPTDTDDCYTREEMIDFLNSKLAGTDVRAMEYGESSIMLGSEVATVTGLRGNMFEIDDPNDPNAIIATSVFYDNTKYGNTYLYPAEFLGGDILCTSDSQFSKIHIDDSNNTLRVKVNGGNYQTVTLSAGDYDLNSMISHLNTAFSNAGVELKAEKKTGSTVPTQGGSVSIPLSGIRITTKEKGKNASIEFDTTTAAYRTLFTECNYTNTGRIPATQTDQYNVYRFALQGGRAFSDADFPLTLTDSNNKMNVALVETPIDGSNNTNNYTITLPAKAYTGLDDILSALNAAFEDSGLDGKISATKSADNRIRLVPDATNKTVGSKTYGTTTITLSGAAATTLFSSSATTPNENDTTQTKSGNPPSLTIPTDLPATINGHITYRFNVNGNNHYVSFPEDSYTPEEFAARINSELTGSAPVSTPKSAYATGQITGTDKNVHIARSGSESEGTVIKADVKGDGEQQQGTTTHETLTPASYTLPVSLPSSITLDDTNNILRIRVNGSSHDVILTGKTYTSPQELADEIQARLDDSITRSSEKVKVTLGAGNRLTFETVLQGKNASLYFGNNSGVGSTDFSTFLRELTLNRYPASASLGSNITLKNSVSIPAGTSLTLKINGENKSVSWDTAASYSSRSDFLTALNGKLAGIGASASCDSSGYMTFSTKAGGADQSIEIDTAGANTAISTALFGDLQTHARFSLSNPLKTDSEIVPMEEGRNTFSIKVDGQTKTATFTPGVNYSRSEILAHLKSSFADVATVSMSNGYLTFVSKSKGSSSVITLGDNTPASSAYAGMFGQTTSYDPPVTAEIVDNKLRLTGDSIGKNYSITMYPKDGSDILPAPYKTDTTGPTRDSLSYLYVYNYETTCYHVLENPVVINSSNNTLSFRGNNNGTSLSKTITLPEGSYTPQSLIETLQSAMDEALGAGNTTVSTNSLGALTISSKPNYNIQTLNNWSGGFYTRYMKGDVSVHTTAETSYTDGKQLVGDTYIVGRKDVRNQTTVISPGTNDTMALELWIDNTPHTLSVKLDPGSYSGSALVDMLNSKLSAAAQANGLPSGIVRAGIGKFHTGVAGSDDANALDFYLNSSVDLPQAKYKIEGLTGSSLFDIFYKTVGSLTPAFTSGTKDLSGGVEIPDNATDFSFDVDGTTYTLSIPPGSYTKDEFIDTLNTLIDSASPKPSVKASVVDGAIRFSHEKVGAHSVKNIRGPAINSFFYQSEGKYGESDDLWLQVGANALQGITFSRYSVSSHALGVNSVNVTEKKYADKALVRIDTALNNLMSSRSRFGALENRLEYTYNNDTNAAENLQDAESRIRDADMAEEMMQLAKKNILEQAGLSVLTQASKNPQSVLQLLT